MALPADARKRKAIPMYSGLLKYFPRALAAVAKHSHESNEQHNPGEPLHWAREKSSDHCDCIARHLTDYAAGDKTAMKAIAWRALAQLELDEEETAEAVRKEQEAHNHTPYRYRCRRMTCSFEARTPQGLAAHYEYEWH